MKKIGIRAWKNVRAYKAPFELLDKALKQMKFYRTKTTPFIAHYRRGELHVTLRSRMKKKGRASQKVKTELGKGNITMLKVHKDIGFPHEATTLNASERQAFFSELFSLVMPMLKKQLENAPKKEIT